METVKLNVHVEFHAIVIHNLNIGHCLEFMWKEFDDNEKWKTRIEESPPKKIRVVELFSSKLDDGKEVDGDGEDRRPTDPTLMSRVGRTDERKRSKKMIRDKEMHETMRYKIDELTKSRKKLAEKRNHEKLKTERGGYNRRRRGGDDMHERRKTQGRDGGAYIL